MTVLSPSISIYSSLTFSMDMKLGHVEVSSRFTALTDKEIIEMRVHMDCAGCESKIKKALQKVKGVDDIDIDMGMQKVTVTGYADQKKVLKTVRKTGRRAEVWQFPYNPELRNSNYAGNYNYQQNYSGPSTYYASQPSSSCYNYYKHGYDNHNNVPSYGGGSQGHSTIFGNRAGDTFSDENPHGCSIM